MNVGQKMEAIKKDLRTMVDALNNAEDFRSATQCQSLLQQAASTHEQLKATKADEKALG